MPSEPDGARRLHPASILFGLAGYARAFAVPALLLFFGAGSRDDSWRLWGMALAIPAALASVARYLSFTYAYGDDELIVRSGIIFRKERHIPYNRIQNIDAAQNVLQRLLGVYNVTLDTGGGGDAEAALNVLPGSALTEMRRRAFREQPAGVVTRPEAEPVTVLLRLGLRDLALCGFIRGRGLLVLGAIVGAAFEFGLDDAFFERQATDASTRERAGAFLVALSFDVVQVAAALALFAVLVLLLRVASMIYTMQRLYDFSLTLARGELRMTYGLLTRVKATIPLRRIQTVTLRDGPLHRWFGVTSLRADTAGGGPGPEETASPQQPYLAPVVAASAVPSLLEILLPGLAIAGVEWERPHGRAVRRAFARQTVLPLGLAAALAWFAAAWAVPVLAGGLALALVYAHRQVRHMGHAISGGYFLYKSGWIWRHVTAAPLAKVQSVACRESPIDRRHGMAQLIVDTAGAAGAPHRLHVPWLDRGYAVALAAALADRAARSSLRW
jgi:putative membrane protein